MQLGCPNKDERTFKSSLLRINNETSNQNFQNCASNITGDMMNFVQISTILVLFRNKNLSKILYISVNIDSNKADHILEMQGPVEFCDYSLQNSNSKIKFKKKCRKLVHRLKTTFQSSCFCSVSWDTLYHIETSLRNIYNKTRQFIHAFPIAGQTAGPNGLKLFVKFFFPRTTPVFHVCQNHIFLVLWTKKNLDVQQFLKEIAH